MRTNHASSFPTPRTHEGAPSRQLKPLDELRRTVSACLLFEDNFYESGVDVAKRIQDLATRAPLLDVLQMAQDLRHRAGLRHAPLWLLNAYLDHPMRHSDDLGRKLSTVIANIAGSRGDLPGELLAMYFKGGKKPIAKALKRGLADALCSLSSYSLQKYAARGPWRLRDVLFLTHAKPRDALQAEWFKKLADDTLGEAGTWENKLSAGADKQTTFTTMLQENSLGALAILRNLRNMVEAGVPHSAIAAGLEGSVHNSRYGVLPFQFVAAARAVPSMEAHIEKAMLQGIRRFMSDNATDVMIEQNTNLLSGHTLVLVDVSGSMQDKLSEKSTLNRADAAGAMAILLREVGDEVSVFDYNTSLQQVPARRGFALRDALRRPSDGTYTGKAVTTALHVATNVLHQKVDRVIVITDEQSADTLPALPTGVRGYVMNVAPYQNGVTWGRWVSITGFSENLVKFIMQAEANGYV